MPANIVPAGSPSPDTSMTPGRQTRAVFDVPDYFLGEDGFCAVRMRGEVAKLAGRDKAQNSKFHSNMRYWGSGAWTLAPVQEGDFQEKVPVAPFVYVPPASGSLIDLEMAVAINTLQLSIWKRNNGSGLSYGSGIETANADPFFQRQIPAGTSWAAGLLTAPSDHAAQQSSLPALTQPLGFVMAQTNGTARANQGYCLRFSVPGTQAHHPDIVGAFHFGGTASGTKPQYALVLKGDGTALLREYGQNVSGGAYAWGDRFQFRYCRPAQVCDQTHKIIIFPLVGPQGEKFIHFACANLDATESQAAGVLSVAGSGGTGGGATSPTERVYQWDYAVAGTLDGSPGNATGAGKWWLSERVDRRNLWQVSKLTFWVTGTLADLPISLPTSQSVRTFAYAGVEAVPATTVAELPFALTHQIVRNDTGAVITTSGGSTPPKDVYLSWILTSDTSNTPVLWGYTLSLPPVSNLLTPGEFACSVTAAHLSGGESNPQQEQATVEIKDVLDAAPRLRNRGQLSIRVETLTAPIAGCTDTFPVILFRGTASRPHGERVGKPVGGGQGMATPAFRSYTITAAGMWERLSRKNLRMAETLKNFVFDPAAPPPTDGLITPWKVTDAITYLLKLAGFPASMIRIADNPIRCRPGIGAPPTEFIVDPNTDIAQMVVRLARNYLGMFLHFAPNDGTVASDGSPLGQWVLLGPPADTAPAIWNFVSGPTQAQYDAGGAKLWNLPGAYPAKTTASVGNLEGYPVPPEANHILVVTAPDMAKVGGLRIENGMFNPYSYAVPGSSIVPDPDSPHYLGYFSPLIIADPTLWGGDGTLAYKQTQDNVDFAVLREFTYACLPRRIQPIHAPLVIALDAETNRRRLLRFYDKVTWNGQAGWYVRNCDPIIGNWDGIQMANYELERTIPMGATS